MADVLPPLPQPNADTQEFWDGCRRGELRLQRCDDCGTARFAPRPACPRCASLRYAWFIASGRGKVYSWTIVHAPTLPAFADRVPYAMALVELDEGPFLVGQLRDCDHARIRAGLRVEVFFEAVAPDVTLPHWRPA
jgi:uncharacterized OB-fold protein